jgi:hypothetical protein
LNKRQNLSTSGAKCTRRKWWKDRLRCWQICVIVGVLGELISDGGIFLFSRTLQRLEGAEITDLGDKAKRARDDAAVAISNSDIARGKADAASLVAGQAKDTSNSAKTTASDALTTSRVANHEAQKASILSAKAGEIAASAAANARTALDDAGSARRQTLDTAAELKQEHDTRMELEKSVQPRNLLVIEDGKNNFEPLVPFVGQKYLLEYVPDMEAFRAATRIFANVESAKWYLVKRPSANPDAYQSFFDGVVVQYFIPKEDSVTRERSPADIAATERSEKAAEALVHVLTSHGWIARAQIGGKANTRSDGATNPPSDTLLITVGFKPSPYFDLRSERNIRPPKQ